MHRFVAILLAVALGAIALPAGAGNDLKVYVSELNPAVGGRLALGYDRDAVCTNGLCDNASTVCNDNVDCTGIGSGQCNYTPCTSDFALCEDNQTICGGDSDCTGIGSGQCVDNPCAPPNQICGVKVESLTLGAPVEQTIWQLVCDPQTLPDGADCQVGFSLPATTVSWDFSEVNSANYPDLKQRASTWEEIETAEFEPSGDNSGDCGFDPGDAFPGRTLNREDKNYGDPANVVPTLNSTEREDDVMACADGTPCVTDSPDCDGIGDGTCSPGATIWLRGVVRFEGIDSPTLGAGESRLCHTDDDGTDRTGVPLWRLPNQDADGYFMELGDPRWTHTVYDCEPIILSPSTARAQSNLPSYEGRQSGEIVNEGLVKLPSGHQFQSLVSRSRNEYKVAINFLGQCNIPVDNVRTVLYLWVVPHVGSVVRLQSDKIATNLTDFIHLSEIDVKYGLFPPLTLNVGPVTGGSIDVSWNPGSITSHIDGYRVYWSEESGGSCSIGGEDCTADHPGAGTCSSGETCCGSPGAVCNGYDFDSVNDAGQVSFNSGCALAPGDTECATISLLDPGTTYYVTVTATSGFTNPASGVLTSYESTLYPTQIPAVPVDLPIEVSATTIGAGGGAGAVPDGDDRPGLPLVVARTGNAVTVSWGASCVPTTTDYALYSGTVGSFYSHDPLTCSTAGATGWGPFVPGAGDRYFLAVPREAAVEGSYGLDSANVERPVGLTPCLAQSNGNPVCP